MNTTTSNKIEPVKIIQVKEKNTQAILATFNVFERTFEALAKKRGSKARKRLNDNFLTSTECPEYKFAMQMEGTGGLLLYRTVEEAERAAINICSLD